VTNFNVLREQLRLDRQQAANADADLLEATELLRRSLRRQRDLERRINTSQPDQIAELSSILQEVTELRARIDLKRETLKATWTRIQSTADAFHLVSDPTTNITNLDDNFPVMLFPVRLETRFKQVEITVGQGPNAVIKMQHQLWVRVYPDTCLTDTFEETLSETEIRNAKRYWQQVWLAAGNEAGERSAWRALVSSHGSGRSEWIVKQFRPLNELERPLKVEDSEVILVIESVTPPSPKERMAVEKFWRTVWFAERDLEQESAARQALNVDCGPGLAQRLINLYRPINLDEFAPPGVARSAVELTVALLIFPEDTPSKERGWNRAPRVDLLPDRFVLMTYTDGVRNPPVVGAPVRSPLVVGIDPQAPADEQMRQDENGNLNVPDPMQWMVDFDRAVEWGMGFRINLTPQQAAQGFERLLVLGVRMESSADEGRKLVERLLLHHHYGKSGIGIVPQGTPTNNTEGRTSGHSRIDDPDESFDRLFKQPADFSQSLDPFEKPDRQWLGEMLGLDFDVLKTIDSGTGRDQAEAKAMNRVLCPATLRYFMSTLMHPVFEDETVDLTEWYFTRFVSGRGAIPAIRIGSQPYGILPTTAFKDINWLGTDRLLTPQREFLTELHKQLLNADKLWGQMSSQVAAVSRQGADAHKTLLEILGLQPTSVEYHGRFFESRTLMFNILGSFATKDFFDFSKSQMENVSSYLKDNFDLSVPSPDIAELFPFSQHFQLHGPLIEDFPLSETEPLHPVIEDSNYLQWLSKSALANLDDLRLERKFDSGTSPKGLLYLLVRHSLMLGYHDAAYRLYKSAGFLHPDKLSELKREPAFVHIDQSVEVGEEVPVSNSRWRPLYTFERRISNAGESILWKFIADLLFNERLYHIDEIAPFKTQVASLTKLETLPTARLERLIAEHLDCCSYRFDAWMLGLCHVQLSLMRYRTLEDKLELSKPGVYVGAFAWLENVRAKQKVLTPVTLEPDLEPVFQGVVPVQEDSTNGGYVHAPSLNHAVTAAILRNGYRSNSSPANEPTLSVNLSSNRVRLALSFLEGMRNGQSLGALLGYQLERGLHDFYELAACDLIIYELRSAFPFRSDNLQSTVVAADTQSEIENNTGTKAIESIEARNVVDGLKLVEHIRDRIRQGGNPKYPFDLSLPVHPNIDEKVIEAVNLEVGRLLDIHDALGDLALAEGVHQATQGNFDRASAAMTSMTTGNYPPEPAVVKTPLKGIVLTHRIGLHLDVDITVPELEKNTAPPRKLAEPALNRWLNDCLPAMDKVVCTVTWFRIVNPPDTGGISHEELIATVPVRISDLALQPLDWLAIVPLEATGQLSELDDRIMRFVFRTGDQFPGTEWRIEYGQSTIPDLSVSAVALLTRSLRTLIQKSRPLNAVDISRQDFREPSPMPTSYDENRIIDIRRALVSIESRLNGTLLGLSQLLDDQVARHDEIVNNIDWKLVETVEVLENASRFGIPQSGWGFLFRGRLAFHTSIRRVLAEPIDRMRNSLQDFRRANAAYVALPTGTSEDMRISLLRQAESSLTAVLMDQPATIAEFEQAIANLGTAVSKKLDRLIDLVSNPTVQMSAMRSAVQATLPLSRANDQPFDMKPIDGLIVDLMLQMQAAIESVHREVALRLLAADAQLTIYSNSTQGTVKGGALIKAAQAILGDDFRFIPRFSLASDVGEEWRNALSAVADGSSFKHLREKLEIDFPVDEWLYGVARIRQQLTNWERIVVCCEAFAGTAPELIPAQFPYRKNEPWLALEYPPMFRSEGDRLLYTASYATPFDPTREQAGLLLDEWTEVIPSPDPGTPDPKNPDELSKTRLKTTHETGLSFHYDRPNNEAPQTILLVVPATWDGTWKWNEVVAALESALELAKKRAVEPDLINRTQLAQFLPASVMAHTSADISIGTLLASNNGVVL